jgi:hypothetical protein
MHINMCLSLQWLLLIAKQASKKASKQASKQGKERKGSKEASSREMDGRWQKHGR